MNAILHFITALGVAFVGFCVTGFCVAVLVELFERSVKRWPIGALVFWLAFVFVILVMSAYLVIYVA